MNIKKVLVGGGGGLAIATILILSFGVTIHAHASACTASITGSWSSTSTWGASCNGAIPQSTDSVVINAGVTVTGDTTSTITALTLNGGSSASILNMSHGITVSGACLINAPSSSATNSLAIGVAALSCGTGLTIAGGSSGLNSQVTMSTGVLNVLAGGITFSGATAASNVLNNTAAGTMNISGAISSGGTVTVNPGTVTNFSGASAINGAYTFGVVNINQGGTLTLGTGTIIFAGNLTVSDGSTLTMGNFAFTESGTTMVGSGTSGIINIGTSGSTGTRTFTGLVTVNAGGTFDLTGGTPATSFNGGIFNNSINTFRTGTGAATFSASSTFSGSGPIMIGGTATIGSGAVIINNNTGIVTFSNTVTGTNASSGIATSLNSDTVFDGATTLSTGILTPYNGTNTIEYDNAGGQTVKANAVNSYYNLIFGGSGAKSLVAGITNVSGTLTFAGTASATTVANLSIGGGLTLSTGTSFTVAASYTVNVSGTVSVAGTGIITNNSTGGFTISTNLTGTGTFAQGTNAVLNLGGATSITTLTATATGNTVNYINTLAGETVIGTTYTNLTINGSGQIFTLGGNATTTGNLTIATGTFDVSSNSYALHVAGSFVNSSGTFNAESGTVTLYGTPETVSGNNTFYNLVIATTSATQTIKFTSGSTQTINGSFVAQGSSAHKITITATASSSAALFQPSNSTTSVSYATISYSTVTGGSWQAYLSNGNVNGGNNSGWTFDVIPNSPANFTLYPGNGQVSLSWSAPANNGALLTNYAVEYKPAAGNTWFIFSTLASTTLTALVTGLTNNVSYNFEVAAFSTIGQGNPSILSATPLSIEDTPGAVTVTTFAGLAGGVNPSGGCTTVSSSFDGIGSAARFGGPKGTMGIDSSGNVYLNDWGCWTLRKITPLGAVNTIAAGFNNPASDAIDSLGNIYVDDTSNDVIKEVTPQGVVSVFAGQLGVSGSVDGSTSTAEFNAPTGITVDNNSGNVYVSSYSDCTIREITPAGMVNTIAGLSGACTEADGTGSAARFGAPSGIGTDSSGNIYVADETGNTIRKVTPSGVVTTIAGQAGIAGSADGTGSAARFNVPSWVQVDAFGNIYATDYLNYLVRKITPSGVVTTIAGQAGIAGSVDGPGSVALFNHPDGIGIDRVNNIIYIADRGNFTVRKITFSPSSVSITNFSLSATSTSLTVPITSLTTSGVPVGYFISESPTTPSSTNPGWVGSIPASYTFQQASSSGILYAWAKDSAGNISDPAITTVNFPYYAIPASGTLQDFVLSGIVTSPDPSIASTTEISFNYPVKVMIANNMAMLMIPASTTFTTASSSDFTGITATTSVMTTDLPINMTSVAAMQYGLASSSITLSQPVTIAMAINTAYDNQTLTIYREDEGAGWQQIDVCVVASGSCSFTTSNLSSFAVAAPIVVTPPPSSPVYSSGGGGGGGGGSAYDLSINNGASQTATTSVTLSLYGTGAYVIEISNTSDFSSSTWIPYITTLPWTLTSNSGQQTIYAQFKAISGTIVGSTEASIDLISPSTSTPVTVSSSTVSTSVPTSTSSVSTASLTAEIADLQAQLAALETEINQSSSSSQFIFTRDLQFGMTGSDVKQLQLFLIAQASGSAAAKLKAHGTTQNFGILTQNALIEFQKKEGITPAEGYFGEKTRGWVDAHSE